RWLPLFQGEDRFHIALVAREAGAGPGWSYHQTVAPDADATGAPELTATRGGKAWVISGSAPFVANAPVAGLFVVQAKVAGGDGMVTLLLPRTAPGLTVGESLPAFGARGERARWHHGAVAPVTFKDCRVAEED